LWINLFDWRPDTTWYCRGQSQPNVQPEWVRVDLARESVSGEIVLVPREDGLGIPNDLTI
jgi:hypothetical protein